MLNVPRHMSLYPSRYLVVLYYQANKAFKKVDTDKKAEELQKMKEKYNLATPGREGKWSYQDLV